MLFVVAGPNVGNAGRVVDVTVGPGNELGGFGCDCTPKAENAEGEEEDAAGKADWPKIDGVPNTFGVDERFANAETC